MNYAKSQPLFHQPLTLCVVQSIDGSHSTNARCALNLTGLQVFCTQSAQEDTSGTVQRETAKSRQNCSPDALTMMPLRPPIAPASPECCSLLLSNQSIVHGILKEAQKHPVSRRL